MADDPADVQKHLENVSAYWSQSDVLIIGPLIGRTQEPSGGSLPPDWSDPPTYWTEEQLQLPGGTRSTFLLLMLHCLQTWFLTKVFVLQTFRVSGSRTSGFVLLVSSHTFCWCLVFPTVELELCEIIVLIAVGINCINFCLNL